MKSEEEIRLLLLRQSKDHNAHYNEIEYSRIAHTMTVLAAILALVAGLTTGSPSTPSTSVLLLRVLYILSAATLVVGAVAIRGRALSHQIAREKLESELQKEQLDFKAIVRDKSYAPLIYNICYFAYDWFFYASILTLAAYGIARTF